MAYLPSFVINEMRNGAVYEALMQGWAKPADARRALKALQKAHPRKILELEL